MKLIVRVQEVHLQFVAIEANSPEEAKALVEAGEGNNAGMEYSHTLESDMWTVRDPNPEEMEFFD